MSAHTGNSLGMELLTALEIDPKNVTEVTIVCKPDKVAYVDVRRLVPKTEEVTALSDKSKRFKYDMRAVLERYQLGKKTEVAE